MWKVVVAILNCRLTAFIAFHNFPHRFRAGGGIGTSTPEAKLLQKLSALTEEVLYVIFLDLQKAYDALDGSRCLEILEGYGMPPRARWLLQTYWRRLTMVTRTGGYYRTKFQGAHGVTQGDPLSPTIFNVVVYAVVRHWVTVVIAGAEERSERGQEGRNQSALFYVDNGMVVYSDPRWIQDVFNTLVGLFDSVDLWTHVRKTVSMVCRTFQAAGNQPEAAYERRITGEDPTYRERQKG